MKINNNFKRALGSAQLIIQAVLLFALFLVMVFYPKASWVHMVVGSLFILVIQAIQIAAGFKNNEQITSKTGGGLPNDDDEEDKP